MGKIKTIGIFLVVIAVAFSGLPAMAAEFKYKVGPRDQGLFENLIRYYEVSQDYSIDLRTYFADGNSDNLPGGLPDRIDLPLYDWQPLGWKKYPEQIQALQDHIANLPPIKWDFIELEAGILTVKKGYRWDGASTIFNDCNLGNNRDEYIRGSCVHDSIYDLMRMGYLVEDYLGNANYEHWGFLNRLMADCMMHMIFKEDGESTLVNEFKLVRYGGAPNTNRDATNLCGHPLLAGWKYHASELTAWPSQGNIELRFLPGDAAARDPNGYDTKPHIYKILRKAGAADDSAEWRMIALITDDPSLNPDLYYSEDWDVYYTDSDIEIGKVYSYQVELLYEPAGTPLDRDHWHYDKSNVETVASPMGRGNALWLNVNSQDSIQDFVSADLVSNDLSGAAITMEAWVYPEDQAGISAIMAFNTASGGDDNQLMYDGDNRRFCYYDDHNRHIRTAAELVPGRWYHVAVVINNADVGVLYVDGARQDIYFDDDPQQTAATFTTTIRPTRTARFSIGQEWNGPTPSQFFKGGVDEVRVWTIARNQTQIQDGMAYALRGDETGLVGLWHFDEPARALSAYDATPDGNDGVLMRFSTAPPTLVQGNISHVRSKAMTPYVDPASGLLAHYPFDGNAWDQSGNGVDGNVAGAVLTDDRFGNAVSAYEFDGGDYISLPQVLDFGQGDNTVACWVKIPTDVSGRVGIVLGNYSAAPNANFEIHADGQLRIYWNRGERSLYGTTDLRDGLWHHIAFVRHTADDQFYAYIDGVNETLSSHGSAGANLIFSAGHRIGADWRGDSTTPFFNGAMDDLRVYTRALTIDELFDFADADDDGLPDRWEMDSGLDPLSIDTDSDGIADGDEDPDGDGLGNSGEYHAGTGAHDADSDDDGMPDGWEVNNDLDPLTDNPDPDPDGDGLGNLAEYNAGTDPNEADSDEDGLTDGQEVNTHLTDPLDEDSDDDGLTDGREVALGTDPNAADSDGDGLTDGEEVSTHSTDATDADSDDDGVPDGWEIAGGLNPLSADGDADPDGDGLNNLGEFAAGTDPNDADGDEDGLADGQEVNTCATDPNDADSDDDGLTDYEEVILFATDPNHEDPDGDGYSDGQELLHDSEPNSASGISGSMTIYVKAVNTAIVLGNTWQTALTDLQKAIEWSIPGDEIWVAKGTYYPSKVHGGTGDRYKSFQMRNNVSIYGGFAGDEEVRAQRDIQQNETILSGDIGEKEDFSDNSFHVFYHPEGTNLDGTAILDGFTITGGYGRPTGNEIMGYENGGGMYNESSSPTISNCIFTMNEGWTGGGMFNRFSSPTLTNCTFTKNFAVYGAGMDNRDSSPILTNCTFHRNYAGNDGGGMENSNSSPKLLNCIISMNEGGGMRNTGSSPELTNCTFVWNDGGMDNPTWGGEAPTSYPVLTNCIMWGNAPEGGREIVQGEATVTISYSNIQSSGGSDSWDTSIGIDGGNNIDADPLFIGTFNPLSFEMIDLHLTSDSPCIDAGDPFITEGRDMDGEGRVFNGITDMGADEFVDGDGDGISDVADSDDDNDGILDEDDAFPTDPNETSDNDGDGTGDNADSDDDNDGIGDDVEDAHPNGGDGNGDTLADRLQNNVTSMLSNDGGEYITLETPAGTSLSHCQAAGNPSSTDAPSDIDFPYGFIDFTINGIGPGDSTTLTLYFPADAELETYYKYGQTPDDTTDHWYEFIYDGETGAEIDAVNKIVTLHFTDALRGDDILVQDSLIIDLGGPGTTSDAISPAAGSDSGGGSGGGCFINSLYNTPW